MFERKVNGKWGWYENGDENRHGKYMGEIENGKPNDQGTVNSPAGYKYEGEFKDGEWHAEMEMRLSGSTWQSEDNDDDLQRKFKQLALKCVLPDSTLIKDIIPDGIK